MTFSHDTEHSLQTVVDFVNTSPDCAGEEELANADDLRVFVTKHHVSAVTEADYDDLPAIRAVRSRFSELFGLDDPRVIAARVNSLLAESSVVPRLTDHDGYGWHMHYFAPGASLAEHLAADGGMAMAQVVNADETDRLRVCDAPDCDAVLIDLSRNRSKRYCDARACGNRLHVAAYRERRRSAERSGRA